jgi:hypothetical protein
MTDAPQVGHEERDVRIRPVVISTLVLGGVIVATMLLMAGLLRRFDARPSPEAPPLAAEYGRSTPPAPRLQTNPRADLEQLRAEEDAALHGYAWVDRQAGTVRIPIERAMALLAERGR